jgi:hypothetical protein
MGRACRISMMMMMRVVMRSQDDVGEDDQTED